jgi:peptidoglycan/LPS O-acetylase OafA/YrhL
LLFSLLLPLYVVIAARTRRWWPLAVVVLLAMSEVGLRTGHRALIYLPVFGLGAVLAANRDRIGALAARWNRTAWIAVSIVAVLFLVANWTPIGHRRSQLLPIVGAALAVFVFLECPLAQRLGVSRPLQALGRWSFSLYLIHEPIVVTTALLLRTTNAAIVLAISLPVSLLAAAGFFRVIEGPAHALSQRVRAALSPRATST